MLLGNGDGSFGVKTDYGTGDAPTSVAIGDLNGDGKPDLATANFYSSTVSVLLNIGAGSNAGPVCGAATPVVTDLWPPNHQMSAVMIAEVSDPDGDPVTITVIGVTQDEPVSGRGAGNTSPDARIVDGQAQVRAERAEVGNGRVYRISFRAEDGRGGHCEGAVEVCVPHDQRPGHSCVDEGQRCGSSPSIGPKRRAPSSNASACRRGLRPSRRRPRQGTRHPISTWCISASQGSRPFPGLPSLWRSDGTAAGTRKVQDISVGGPVVTVGTRTYFPADDGIVGMELWSARTSILAGNATLEELRAELDAVGLPLGIARSLRAKLAQGGSGGLGAFLRELDALPAKVLDRSAAESLRGFAIEILELLSAP